MVCEPQRWLDGVKTGNGVVRQFVAMPQKSKYTVESQLTGRSDAGGMQILVYGPKPGRFPADEWDDSIDCENIPLKSALTTDDFEMGISAGGKMHQKIYEDPYGADTWDETSLGGITVHIVNSHAYREITGELPPATPITAKTYTEQGLPWYSLYDEKENDIKVSENLYSVKSVKLVDKIRNLSYQQDDTLVDVNPNQIKKVTQATPPPVPKNLSEMRCSL